MDVPNYHFLPRRPSMTDARGVPHLQQHEIVEISSDEEDVDDGQPEASRRVNRSEYNTKRAVEFDTNEGDFGTQLDYLHHYLEPARKKRQKLSNTESDDEYAFHFDPWLDPLQSTQAASHEDPQLAHTNNDSPSTELNTFHISHHNHCNRAAITSSPNTSVRDVKISTHAAKLVQIEKDRLAREIAMEKQKYVPHVQPYYDDLLFETRMYCGPGYELFPIVLGTIPEHQKICDIWDQQEVRKKALDDNGEAVTKNNEDPTGDDQSHVNIDKALNVHTGKADNSDSELDCLCRIREVLPDIQLTFALDQIREHVENFRCIVDSDVQIQPDPAAIVAQILELSAYPKQPKVTQGPKAEADGTGITIQWREGDAASTTYQRDAICLLAGQFVFIPTHFIAGIVQDEKSLSRAYQSLRNAEDQVSLERPYRRLVRARTQLEKKYALKPTDVRSKHEWEGLVNELQAAKQTAERSIRAKVKIKDMFVAEEANLQEHKSNGTLVECQCCFDADIPINRAVCCEDEAMHWVCFDCVRGLAESQVGLMKHEMKCTHENGCQASLSMAGIRQAISIKLFDKLAFYQQQFEISSACIEGLEQCPFCEFKAICDPVEEDVTFRCQNTDCERVSCRKCHTDSHLPKTCEEVKADRRISARHRVEEARSEAMMRPCPKCKVKIIKEVGCNKMKCTNCGCAMCYVCKMDISSHKEGGYGHFNNKAAPGTTACILYDRNFDRHEAEADEAEREAIRKVQAEDDDIDEKQLQIHTGDKAKKPLPPPNHARVRLGWDDWDHNLDNARARAMVENAPLENAMGIRGLLNDIDEVNRERANFLGVDPWLANRPNIPNIPNFMQTAMNPDEQVRAAEQQIQRQRMIEQQMAQQQRHITQNMVRDQGIEQWRQQILHDPVQFPNPPRMRMPGLMQPNAQNEYLGYGVIGQPAPVRVPVDGYQTRYAPVLPTLRHHTRTLRDAGDMRLQQVVAPNNMAGLGQQAPTQANTGDPDPNAYRDWQNNVYRQAHLDGIRYGRRVDPFEAPAILPIPPRPNNGRPIGHAPAGAARDNEFVVDRPPFYTLP